MDFNPTTISITDFVVPDTGRWYAEFTAISGELNVGILSPDCFDNAGNDFNAFRYQYNSDGNKFHQPTGTEAYGDTWTTGDIIGVELNGDNNELTFYKWCKQGVAYTVPDNRWSFFDYGFTTEGAWNYGQRPLQHQPDGTNTLVSTELPAAQSPTGVITSGRLLTLGQTS